MTPDLTRARWRKSSRSHNGGNCVEVASTTEAIAIRDSKDAGGPLLTVSPDSWAAFIDTCARVQ